MAEMKIIIENAVKRFPKEDLPALRTIVTGAMENSPLARETVMKLFPDIPLNLGTLWNLTQAVYDCMSEEQRRVSDRVTEQSLAIVGKGGNPSCSTVAALRLNRGMTQKALAEKCKMNIRWVQKLEAGEIRVANITGENLIKLADALEVDPRELVKL